VPWLPMMVTIWGAWYSMARASAFLSASSSASRPTRRLTTPRTLKTSLTRARRLAPAPAPRFSAMVVSPFLLFPALPSSSQLFLCPEAVRIIAIVSALCVVLPSAG